MDKKQLGKTNMYVNPVGLGCMGLSHAYGTAISDEKAIEFIKKVYEIGYTFF